MKLMVYGLSQSALEMLNSYLTNRKQCVKIGQNTSDLLDIVKGVTQGSILVPILFNIFVNYLFFFVHKCELYNYADDNTLSKSDKSLEKVIASLEENRKALINWFSSNKMQANPEKFQAISLGKKTHDKNIIFNLDGISIVCDDEVKRLGVTIDFKLNFNSHITNICKKAARQLNVLKWIGKHLDGQIWQTYYLSFIYYVKF
jgi:hypothetical protein